MRKVIKVDETGLYINDVILNDKEETPSDCIETLCPDGFYWPKWNGTAWVDGGTAPAESPEQAIVRLKTYLAETDYAVIKIAEGAATAEEYADVIAQRQAWRAEINQLENSVD